MYYVKYTARGTSIWGTLKILVEHQKQNFMFYYAVVKYRLLEKCGKIKRRLKKLYH